MSYEISEKLISLPLTVEEKEKIKKEIKDFTCFQDVFSLIMSYVFEEGPVNLDTKILHTKLYEAKEKYAYKGLFFEEVVFNTSGTFPYSGEIERGLFNLSLCGFLKSIGPDFNPHFIEEEGVHFLQKKSKKFNKRRNEIMKEIGYEIRDYLEEN